jgi:CRISPR-associated protein Cmr2
MQPYREYVPSKILAKAPDNEIFDKYLDLPKQMGPSTHSALSRALLDFSNQLVPYLTEQRYAGKLIYSGGDDVLGYTNLWEWNHWLWDIRQCFRGDKDPKNEFSNQGNYWQWQSDENNPNISKRPLFTMGKYATISFGIVIAHHSVPLAITLENMWSAEEEAKEYTSPCEQHKKDAVQVRILYGNGNSLKATCRFDVFDQWQKLIDIADTEASLFEQAVNLWEQHPAPISEAIGVWTQAFCDRREQLKADRQIKADFQNQLTFFLKDLWKSTPEENLLTEVQNWLKIAAFVKRNREIKLGVKYASLV